MSGKQIDRSTRNFRLARISYVVALLIIASLAIGTHFVIETLVEKQAEAASLIGMSGRQRMLSQWIAKAALQVTVAADRTQSDATRDEMRKLVELMRTSHEKLLAALQDYDPNTPTGAALREVYYGDQYQLDARVKHYISLSQTVLTTPPAELRPDDPALLGIEAATRGPIIDALDEAVARYQAINTSTIDKLRRRLAALTILMLATVAAEAAFIFRPLFRRLSESHKALLQAASTDSLTGCMNRRYFNETATRELERSRRYESAVAILLLDIDHFKKVNDTYGHDVGDEAIRLVVGSLLEGVRSTDFVGRLGGEEFAIVLPHTDLKTALIVAEKLRQLIAETPLRTPKGQFHPLTVSIGAATIAETDMTIADTLKRADQALYRAKKAGRNRVASDAGIRKRALTPELTPS